MILWKGHVVIGSGCHGLGGHCSGETGWRHHRGAERCRMQEYCGARATVGAALRRERGA
ncbi:hypothetical protein DW66_3247 [Pseudomonas putida]|nr:hypothetical protein DW66_3247 [Pseudomonas putida]AJG13183.1 hypothetical protein RK21_01675 [Pseudomonas plecoglossicida]